MVLEGALMISKWLGEKNEGAVTRDSKAFWSKPGKETRKTGWSSDSIEKNHPLIRSLLAVARGVSRINACMGKADNQVEKPALNSP